MVGTSATPATWPQPGAGHDRRGRPDPPMRGAAPGRRTIVIAEQRPLHLAGLRHMLEHDGRFTVVGEARSAAEAILAAERVRPAVALVALDLPGDGGLATRGIRSAAPGTVVVGLAGTGDSDRLLAALRAGASGLVLTDADAGHLVSVLDQALSGRPAMSPSLAEQLVLYAALEGRTPLAMPTPLTGRELQVLELLAYGQTNRQIAGQLFVAVGTVKIHVEHILGKLGVTGRTAAAVRAVELGLVRRADADAADANPVDELEDASPGVPAT